MKHGFLVVCVLTKIGSTKWPWQDSYINRSVFRCLVSSQELLIPHSITALYIRHRQIIYRTIIVDTTWQLNESGIKWLLSILKTVWFILVCVFFRAKSLCTGKKRSDIEMHILHRTLKLSKLPLWYSGSKFNWTWTLALQLHPVSSQWLISWETG